MNEMLGEESKMTPWLGDLLNDSDATSWDRKDWAWSWFRGVKLESQPEHVEMPSGHPSGGARLVPESSNLKRRGNLRSGNEMVDGYAEV